MQFLIFGKFFPFIFLFFSLTTFLFCSAPHRLGFCSPHFAPPRQKGLCPGGRLHLSALLSKKDFVLHLGFLLSARVRGLRPLRSKKPRRIAFCFAKRTLSSAWVGGQGGLVCSAKGFAPLTLCSAPREALPRQNKPLTPPPGFFAPQRAKPPYPGGAVRSKTKKDSNLCIY
jgi:hypothetical protein